MPAQKNKFENQECLTYSYGIISRAVKLTH